MLRRTSDVFFGYPSIELKLLSLVAGASLVVAGLADTSKTHAAIVVAGSAEAVGLATALAAFAE
jgi:hypothetical protein